MGDPAFNLDQAMAAALLGECRWCHAPVTMTEDGKLSLCDRCHHGVKDFYMSLVETQEEAFARVRAMTEGEVVIPMDLIYGRWELPHG